LEANKVIFKAAKPPLKNLPPSNPSRAYLNLIPKKPLQPAGLPNYALPLKRRLSGDFESANIYKPSGLANNYLTPREINRPPSPLVPRVPSAGNCLARKALANLRPYF
jgi:hypothetical protein